MVVKRTDRPKGSRSGISDIPLSEIVELVKENLEHGRQTDFHPFRRMIWRFSRNLDTDEHISFGDRPLVFFEVSAPLDHLNYEIPSGLIEESTITSIRSWLAHQVAHASFPTTEEELLRSLQGLSPPEYPEVDSEDDGLSEKDLSNIIELVLKKIGADHLDSPEAHLTYIRERLQPVMQNVGS